MPDDKNHVLSALPAWFDSPAISRNVSNIDRRVEGLGTVAVSATLFFLALSPCCLDVSFMGGVK
jgi:hypothetical protein